MSDPPITAALGTEAERCRQHYTPLAAMGTIFIARMRHLSRFLLPIAARNIVPGDLIELKLGDVVPADAVLLANQMVRVT